MNKLYILGALALSSANAAFVGSYAALTTVASVTYVSTVLYTISVTDCLATGSATTLGIFNTYKQYWQFSLNAGSGSYTAIAGSYAQGAFVYNACTHSHTRNWMAQPVMATQSTVGGFGNALVGYGYSMLVGGTDATCAVATIAATNQVYTASATTGPTNLFTAASTTATTKYFVGAQYQQGYMGLTNGASATGTAATVTSVIVQAGPTQGTVATTAVIIQAFANPNTDGLVSGTVQTNWWDFMQTNVIQGQTLNGRGGGTTTTPCGWMVVYAYESTNIGTGGVVAAKNPYAIFTGSNVNVQLWTDNSILKAASAFALTAFAGLLF